MESLGKIVFLPRGEFDLYETYNRLDVVSYQGSSFVCVKDNIKAELPVDGNTWKLVASKGDAYNLTEDDKESIAQIAVGSGSRYKKFYVDNDGYLWVESVDPMDEKYTIENGYLCVEY